MGATGESVRRVTDFGFNPAWSPEGGAIAFATEGVQEAGSRITVSGLWVVTLATARRAGSRWRTPFSPTGPPAVTGSRTGASPRTRASGTCGRFPPREGKAVPITDDEFVDWNPSGRPRATGSSSSVIAAAP